MTDKPAYVSPQHFDSVPIAPPFYFEGVTTRVLPLRAEVSALQHLIDRYANFIPPQVGRFRVALPYVYLMILDYGKLALEAANIGWLAQKEFMFAIPTNLFTLCSGDRWVFQGMKWFSPYIFVDSDISLMLGRRMYGWDKLRIYEQPKITSWMSSPSAPVENAVLLADVYGEIYAGHEQEPKILCQILQTRDRSFDFPFDVDAALRPWTAVRDLAEIGAGLGADFLGSLEAMRSMPARPDVFFAQAMNMIGSASPANPDSSFDVINLKQFRAADQPEAYCYQSLTAAPLRIVGLERIGPLGDNGAGLSPSRGLRVQLSRWSLLPIVSDLGLKVSRTWRGDEVEIAELEPQFPFWYEVNMSYERGRNLAERSFDGVWHVPGGTYRRRSGSSEPRVRSRPGTPLAGSQRFNATMGAASQAVTGPFESVSATLRVLPLLARVDAIREFIDDYLNEPLNNDPEGRQFEPWAERGSPWVYVYLVIGNADDLYSHTDNVGDWLGKDATFYVPVRYYRGVGPARELVDVGLVPAITYASSTTASISRTEVDGVPTRVARFVPATSAWLERPSSRAGGELLKIVAEVLPTLGRGQEAVEIPVITLCDHRGDDERETAERLLGDWGPALNEEVERKLGLRAMFDEGPTGLDLVAGVANARTLAFDLLTKPRPINVFTLKQFRDIERTDRACYQALIALPWTLERVYECNRLPSTLRLEIRDYESQPIVRLLGLLSTLTVSAEGIHSHTIIPVSPFRARVQLCRGLGRRLVYRSTSPRWTSHDCLTPIAGGPTPEMVRARAAMDMGMAPSSRRPSTSTVGVGSRVNAAFTLERLPDASKAALDNHQFDVSVETQRLHDHAGRYVLDKILGMFVDDLVGRCAGALRSTLAARRPPDEPGPRGSAVRLKVTTDWLEIRRCWIQMICTAVAELPVYEWAKVIEIQVEPDSAAWYGALVQNHAVGALLRASFDSTGLLSELDTSLQLGLGPELVRAFEVMLRQAQTWPSPALAGGVYRIRVTDIELLWHHVRTGVRRGIEDSLEELGASGPSGSLPDGASPSIESAQFRGVRNSNELYQLIDSVNMVIDDELTAFETKPILELVGPQPVLESILAKEWFNTDPRTPRARARERLERELRHEIWTSTATAEEVTRAVLCRALDRRRDPNGVFELDDLAVGTSLVRLRTICRLWQCVREAVKAPLSRSTLEECFLPTTWAAFDLLGCDVESFWANKSSFLPDERLAVEHVQAALLGLRELIGLLETERGGESRERALRARILMALRQAYEIQRGVMLDMIASLGSDPDFFVDLSIFAPAEVSRYFPPSECRGDLFVGEDTELG